MERAEIVKIVTIIGVLVMAGSMLAPSMLRGGGNGNTIDPGESVPGIAVINGTIRTYDPLLFADAGYNQSDFDIVREDEGFKDLEKTPDGWILETATRDDVYFLAKTLSQNGVTTLSVANIALPGTIAVMLANGSTIDVVSRGGIVRVVMEPLLEEDTMVEVQFVAMMQNGIITETSNAALMSTDVEELVEADVVSLNYVRHTYSIPWIERGSLDTEELSEYGEVSYSPLDIIYFQRPLTVDEVMAKKQLSYITYIDQHSASVSSGFGNITLLEADFEGIGIDFPESQLVILSNESIGLNYTGTAMRSYDIMLPEEVEGYSLDEREFEIETEDEYNEDEKIEVLVSAMAIGNRIVSVASVLPS